MDTMSHLDSEILEVEYRYRAKEERRAALVFPRDYEKPLDTLKAMTLFKAMLNAFNPIYYGFNIRETKLWDYIDKAYIQK